MDLRYPVGRFEPKANGNGAGRRKWIEEIAELPAQLRTAVGALPSGGLDRPYREGGWTGRQVVHHVADSHLNSYVRVRLALTEEQPTIKTYDESAWAMLEDARTAPVDLSLALIGSLHARWTLLLSSLTAEQWSRKLTHPELGLVDLDYMLQLYSWHGRHHLAHLGLIR